MLFEEAKDLFAPTIVEETTPVVQMSTAPVVETTKIEFVLEPVSVPAMMHPKVEEMKEEFSPMAAAKEEPVMQKSMNPVEHTREVKPAGGFLQKPAVIYAEPKLKIARNSALGTSHRNGWQNMKSGCSMQRNQLLPLAYISEAYGPS